ncbi:DUF421 domain-containing protein [Halalkalibacter hemicellulosilyticus]|uniref:YetF C-terminal domain-containing protein n=1 Tax=Halalkalibacter hemicellulosilyticusJCM 9152 TaxID=1236971 RepID=W4QE68_9BACI|nr:DUF421 domain-containing protein [Halalkalibacter hemicellulosilyticus]GAE30247.1 hypothetical protein JCM9152_1649 [Halalkalibacter hemicellulosilyticusJCM 9152]
MNFIWESIVMIFTGFLLLRVSGRKSIAQMTITTTIVMISIGAIIVQPIIEDSVIKTMITIAIFISILVFIEYLQMKFNSLEKLFTGKAISIIEDGQIHLQNLMKIRLTIDKLEMQIRQQRISNISDIKNATIEPNGQLGYELFPDSKPLTVGEFKKLMGGTVQLQNQSPDVDGSLFYEIKNRNHAIPNPDELK